MRKISLAALAFMISICSLFAQKTAQPAQDSTRYKLRELKVEEINLVSGYYQQSGNHAGVTGGIGSEALTDFANNIDMSFSGVVKNGNKHTIKLDMGIDHYTSASSDKIDPRNRKRGGTQEVIDSALLVAPATRTSASYADTRVYPSVSYTIENREKQWRMGFGASFSGEYDYISRGISASFNKSNAAGTREWGIRGGAFFDTWSLILPVELRTNTGGNDDDDDDEGVGRPRNTFETSFSLMQIVNRRLQLLFLADVAYQQGYLATGYNRVFFNNGSMLNENLPGRRLKTPVGLRANYFLGDRVILRSFYRYYRDNWGMSGHTASLETTIKVTPALSISPNYRLHQQSGINYFAPYKQHAVTETYYSSDYDLSGFKSQFVGVGLRYAPGKRTIIPLFNAIECRTGVFRRSDGLRSWIISCHLKFK